jgi:starch synthase (maltosyl-transferring)
MYLAATLSSNIGIYGPVFEQQLDEAIPGREEYYMSEKFEVKHYNWNVQNKLTAIIAKVNAIRHQHEALQQTNNIKFCHIENDNLMAYYKWNDDKTDELLIIVSLEQYYAQQGTVQLPLADLGVHAGQQITVNDLVTGSSYNWYNEWNFVELHPTLPFHIFKINK